MIDGNPTTKDAVIGLVTLQFHSGGLFDCKPVDDCTVHLVTSTGKGTPGPTLCGLDRFSNDESAAGWSLGGGISGPGIKHTPCPGCADEARAKFSGLEVTGLGAEEMAGVLGTRWSRWNGGRFERNA